MNPKIYKGWLLAIPVALVLSSCASAPPAKKEMIDPEVKLKEIESARQVRAINEKLLMRTLDTQKGFSRDYKIGPEDLLEINVFEVEKLNKTVRVSAQGNITLPLLGVLRVKDLTASELEKEIGDLLAEKYLRDPQVSVFIKEYHSQRILVMGMVEKPGVIAVTGPKTILDMLAMAGGLKEDAGQLLFLIRQPNPEGDDPRRKKGSSDQVPPTSQTFVIDLEELLLKGDLNLNLTLLHGDVINVPASGKIFVGGEVFKPGGYPLKGKRITVSQAITMAEGVKPQADGAEARIFRLSGKGSGKEVIPINAYAILNGQAADMYLKENDILIIPTHGAKNFFIGLRDSLKGLFSIGLIF
jgi:polysaccharide export outer membrane protein